MTELYIPKPGERVRVVDINLGDDSAGCSVGDVVEVHASAGTKASNAWVGWLNLAWVKTEGPTWSKNPSDYWRTICRVEPVAKCACSHDGPDPCCAEHSGHGIRDTSMASGTDDDVISRPPGCECHREIGDSPCAVHPACDHCGWECTPGDLFTNGDRVYCSAKCREHDLPHKYAAQPTRRFCACGQEAWPRGGRVPLDYAGKPLCSDCSGDEARHLWDGKTAVPLDSRIRAAQPEPVEHAWESTHWSWP